jgi:GNAT superfamily N-acetyltransferase
MVYAAALAPPLPNTLAEQDALRSQTELKGDAGGKPEPSVIVPIRSLGANHRNRIAAHILSLDERARYLRFGHNAQDEQIHSYVDGLNFERDEIFGIYDRRLRLIAVAHLAYGVEGNTADTAEFGVSVLEHARGRGYGTRLFERAAMHASNHGVQTMFIHALTENKGMLKIARNAGARVQRDGMESDAYLALPRASLNSRMSELMQEQIGQMDYRLKLQAKHFRGIMVSIQDMGRTSKSL